MLIIINTMECFIGCSGFSYKEWRGKFYPADLPQKKWFDYYGEHFATLELNVTFYRFPRLSFLQNWYQRSSENFRFSVKAPKAITHFKQFHDSVDMISSFYETINNGLKEKLGPVLFQLPPRFSYNEERLERIIQNLDHSFLNVLEFRHASWWQQHVYDELAKHDISFCGMSHPQLPDILIANAPVVYYRFHGVPELYRSSYSTAFLQNIVDQLERTEAQQGWFYFNNDIYVHAIYNAEALIDLVRNKLPNNN